MAFVPAPAMPFMNPTATHPNGPRVRWANPVSGGPNPSSVPGPVPGCPNKLDSRRNGDRLDHGSRRCCLDDDRLLLHNHRLLLHHLRLRLNYRLSARDARRIGGCRLAGRSIDDLGRRLTGVNVDDLGRWLAGLDNDRRWFTPVNYSRSWLLMSLASSKRERA
jgi:hypothetical protein